MYDSLEANALLGNTIHTHIHSLAHSSTRRLISTTCTHTPIAAHIHHRNGSVTGCNSASNEHCDWKESAVCDALGFGSFTASECAGIATDDAAAAADTPCMCIF